MSYSEVEERLWWDCSDHVKSFSEKYLWLTAPCPVLPIRIAIQSINVTHPKRSWCNIMEPRCSERDLWYMEQSDHEFNLSALLHPNSLWYCHHLMLFCNELCLFTTQMHSCHKVRHEGLNITILTRTLLLVSVALDSELSSDMHFIYLHTHNKFSKWACVCIWCVLQATTVKMEVYPRTPANFHMRERALVRG